MEEKKITDEEMFEAWRICTGEDECDGCPLLNVRGCMIKICEQAFDLIQRQQEELDLLKGTNRELTERNAYLKQCADQFLADYKKGQNENERLIEVMNDFRHEVITLNIEKLELQKQVDELKEERENMQAEIMRFEDMKFTQEHCNLYEENEWLKASLQQAVKDTAKEILQYVGDLYDDCDQRFQLKDYQFHKELCKKYGVEVE